MSIGTLPPAVADQCVGGHARGGNAGDSRVEY